MGRPQSLPVYRQDLLGYIQHGSGAHTISNKNPNNVCHS